MITASGLKPSHRRLMSFAALALAAQAFVWFGWSGFTRDIAKRATSLVTTVQGESRTLELTLKRLSAASDKAPSANVFLRNLDTAINSYDIHVVRLVPDPKNEHSIQIELIGGLPNFLRFTGTVEALGATLRDLQINKARDVNGGAGEDFSFTLDRPTGAGFHGAYIDSVQAAAASPDLRDPFMAFRSRDMSVKYQLTAITQIGGRSLATINNLDYAVGDRLDFGTVTAITDDQVTVADDTTTFVLRFQPVSK